MRLQEGDSAKVKGRAVDLHQLELRVAQLREEAAKKIQMLKLVIDQSREIYQCGKMQSYDNRSRLSCICVLENDIIVTPGSRRNGRLSIHTHSFVHRRFEARGQHRKQVPL